MDEAIIDDLVAEQAIRACLHRYARGTDRHDVEMIMSAFHGDATVRHGTFVGGPAELASWLNRIHSRYTRGHQHRVTNLSIARDGDIALTEAYVEFVLWRRDEDTIDVSGGRYIDRFERRASGWRIADRTVAVDYTGSLPAGSGALESLQHYPWGQWDRTDASYRTDS